MIAILWSFVTVCFVVSVAGAEPAHAQVYPGKPVRLVLPSPAGSNADNVARPIAQKLAELLGQPVVIDNRPGANGNIGADILAKSAPDGHTLLQISTAFTISAATYAKLPFDPINDFAPISLIAKSNIVLVVRPDLPAKSVKELVLLARQMPGKLTFASSGNGSSIHLAGELLNTVAGIDMLHVPYKGVVGALIDVVGGRVDMMFIGVSAALPHIKTGKLRALALASSARTQILSSVPTMTEAGLPGFEVPSNFGILAPAGTPKDIIARLNSALVEILQTQDMRTRFAAFGVEPVANTPEEFAVYIRNEIAKWAKVAKAAKIEPQ